MLLRSPVLNTHCGSCSLFAGTTQAPVLPTAPKRPLSRCYGCASTLVTHALEWLHLLADSPGEKQKMVDQGLVQELFESGIHHGSQQASVLVAWFCIGPYMRILRVSP